MEASLDILESRYDLDSNIEDSLMKGFSDDQDGQHDDDDDDDDHDDDRRR